MGGANFAARRRRMAKTGIGLAGAEGVWWLPALEPFTLPPQVQAELAEIGRAMFLLFDVARDLYGRLDELTALLDARVPVHLRRFVSRARVESLRPDFQLRPTPGGGSFQPVATELEICPSAHGFAHAMQVGYGLPADVVDGFARYLNGRPLVIAATAQWSEFLFEQLAFCRALAGVGAQGRVLLDEPPDELARAIRHGERWQPPMFGLPRKTSGWNDDVTGRIRAHGFEPYLWPHTARWPEDVGRAVVFRFGYLENFSADKLRCFQQWEAGGAVFLNPPTFYLDSKALLAALALPPVREAIRAARPESLAALDRCIPETVLLEAHCLPTLLAQKDAWLIKYAGFDGGNNAWGGRSLQIGRRHTARQWQNILRQALELPWPVVAQRLTPSARVDVAYADTADRVRWMRGGVTRLRSFFLRNPDGGPARVCGSHLTVSGGSMQVSEGVDAVQAPVVFSA